MMIAWQTSRIPETTFTTPYGPVWTYYDLFGNKYRRRVAPVGDLMMWAMPRLRTRAGRSGVCWMPGSVYAIIVSRYCENRTSRRGLRRRLLGRFMSALASITVSIEYFIYTYSFKVLVP
jgi:hypothetical protein